MSISHARTYPRSFSRNNAGPWLPKGDPRKPQPSGSQSISFTASTLLPSHAGLLGRQIQSVLQTAVISSGHLQVLGVELGPAAAGGKSPEGPVWREPGQMGRVPKKPRVGAPLRIVQFMREFCYVIEFLMWCHGDIAQVVSKKYQPCL